MLDPRIDHAGSTDGPLWIGGSTMVDPCLEYGAFTELIWDGAPTEEPSSGKTWQTPRWDDIKGTRNCGLHSRRNRAGACICA